MKMLRAIVNAILETDLKASILDEIWEASRAPQATIRAIEAEYRNDLPFKPKKAADSEHMLSGLEKNGRGNLCITNLLIRKIGLKVGQQAYCYIDENDDLILSATWPEVTDDMSIYTVDKSENVTVTGYRLLRAGMDEDEVFCAELVDGEIVISPEV